QPCNLTDCQKMIREFRLAAVNPGRLNEPLPALVSQEAKEAQAASASQMAMDLRRRLLMLFKEWLFCERGCMLYEELLSTRRLDMDLLDECEQFLPSLFMGAAILSRVDGRQFPSLAAGKDTDRLPEFACGLVQGIRRSGPIDALPKIGTELA